MAMMHKKPKFGYLDEVAGSARVRSMVDADNLMGSGIGDGKSTVFESWYNLLLGMASATLPGQMRTVNGHSERE